MLTPAVTASQLAENDALIKNLQYSIANSILTSYSGEYDWLAEVLQNSMDALERRWKAGPWGAPSGADSARDQLPDDLVPRLRVVIDLTTDRALVIDNGIGMSLPAFANLSVPFSTDKQTGA